MTRSSPDDSSSGTNIGRRQRRGWKRHALATSLALITFVGSWFHARLSHLASYDIQKQRRDVGESLSNAAPSSSSSSSSSSRRDEKEEAAVAPDDGDEVPYVTMYGPSRAAESLARLPPWIAKYAAWHRRTRASSDDPSTLRWLVMECLADAARDRGGVPCGGTADRLRPLPYFLLLAHLTERLLIITWETPVDLDAFLEPTAPHGPDWRTPRNVSLRDADSTRVAWVGNSCGPRSDANHCTHRRVVPRIRDELADAPFVIARLRASDDDAVAAVNDVVRRYSSDDGSDESDAPSLEHLFRALFRPVPSLARRVNDTMTALGLVEGRYDAAHARIRYPVPTNPLPGSHDKAGRDQKDDDPSRGARFSRYADRLVVNAVDCAATAGASLRGDDDERPVVFVASDHRAATRRAIERYRRARDDVRVATVDRDREPPHLDGPVVANDDDADAYASVFEDLLILGGARCVAVGAGGFGTFGAGLAGDRCVATHQSPATGRSVSCPNDLTTTMTTSTTTRTNKRRPPPPHRPA